MILGIISVRLGLGRYGKLTLMPPSGKGNYSYAPSIASERRGRDRNREGR
jgi:hypothetical protein